MDKPFAYILKNLSTGEYAAFDDVGYPYETSYFRFAYMFYDKETAIETADIHSYRFKWNVVPIYIGEPLQ